MSVTQGTTQGAATPQTRRERDLETRVSNLEHQLTTLVAAIDAASRLRISTPLRINHDIRLTGGKNVRRILDRGGLTRGYPETGSE
jgi:hypothetical protein